MPTVFNISFQGDPVRILPRCCVDGVQHGEKFDTSYLSKQHTNAMDTM